MTDAMPEPLESHILKLPGHCTIERSQELKQALLDAARQEAHLTLDLDGVEEVDLSFLQLLCSAHRTFSRMGKGFVLRGCKPEVLKQAVRDAGFIRTLGCHQDMERDCLWVGGWES